MSRSQDPVEPGHKLSKNYRGWRPNRRSTNKNDTTKQMYNISFKPHVRTYSAEERISRSITVVLSKLTPDNFTKLLPKIKEIYADVDTMNKLQRFLSVIFERAIMESYFHSLFVNILNDLLQEHNITNITHIHFQQCLATLCDSYFEKHLQKSMNPYTDELQEDHGWLQRKQNRLFLSICRFNGILVSKALIDIATLIQYFKILLEDTMTETNIEAASAQFNEIFKFMKLHNNIIKLKNAELYTIDVDIKTHLLVYGYIGHNVPRAVIDVCIGYYDVNAYLLRYYKILQDIEQNPQFSMRIRLLIKNVTVSIRPLYKYNRKPCHNK